MAGESIGAMCKRLDAMERDWRARLETAIAGAADAALEEARARVPVDTGALKRSLGMQAGGLRARVWAQAEYAAYVEMGTGGARGHAPRPYLRPAFVSGTAEFARRAREVFG